MYRLFKRVNNLKPMSEMMRTFITEEGHGVIKNFESKDELDVQGYIESLLALHEKYSNLINQQMDKDPLFLEAMKDVCLFKKILIHFLLKRHLQILLIQILKMHKEKINQQLQNCYQHFVIL